MKPWAATIALGSYLLIPATFACTPDPRADYSLAGVVERSEQIFIARVIKSEELPARTDQRIRDLVVTFELKRKIKGQPSPYGVVLTSASMCGAMLPVGHEAIFFVDLQHTKYGVPIVDGTLPASAHQLLEASEPGKKFLAELQAVL